MTPKYIYLFYPELTTGFSLSELCIRDTISWMIANKLSVNPNKREYLFLSKTFQESKLKH